MNLAEKRIGETRVMNCGLKATIIAYQKSSDIDIRFENGDIIRHKSYDHFLKGKISNRSLDHSKRIGETRVMNCGMKATIIEYNEAHDITICFEDGLILYHKYYTDFKNGMISHVTIRNDENIKKAKEIWKQVVKEDRIGKTNYNKNGQLMTIKDYDGYDRVTVCFEDGTVVDDQRYEKFMKGEVVNPNDLITTNIRTSLNEYTMLFYLSKYGFSKTKIGDLKKYGINRMELDAFNEDIMMGVEYDGYFHNFHLDNDREKDFACKNAGIELLRIREKINKIPNISSYSKSYVLINATPFSKEFETLLIEICGYISTKTNQPLIQIDFSKDKDIIVSNYRKEYLKSHLGEVFYDVCGEKATIIQYLSSTNVTVRFDDGVERKYKYSALVKGHFNKAEEDNHKWCLKKYRVGEEVITKNGITGTIIKYNNSMDIDVRLSDGTILYHTKYRCFNKS